MLTIDKLIIHGFGRFHNQEFSLQPGLNLIYGGNEAGKSTIHSFIEAMLFGFWQANTQSRQREASWSKYRPWQGEAYGGQLFYTWSGGKVCVQRDFARHGVKVMNLDSGEELDIPLNPKGEPDYARQHFGFSKSVFRNTISIGQLGSATDTAVAQEMRGLLSNLAQSGGSGISVQQGLDNLTQVKKQAEQDLAQVKSSIEKTQFRLANMVEELNQAAKMEIKQYQAAQQLEALQKQKTKLKAQIQGAQAHAARKKLDRLEELQQEHMSVEGQLAELKDLAYHPHQHQHWQQVQGELDHLKDLQQSHQGDLEEAAARGRRLEREIKELDSYSSFNKDTLIEMSSAWQMHVKGQQVIDELEAQLEEINDEVRSLTGQLTQFPYFRLDALEHAASLQAQTNGRQISSAQPQMAAELEEQEQWLKGRKAWRIATLAAIPVAGIATWLQPLAALSALAILPLLIKLSGDIKMGSQRCRKIRRDIYAEELEIATEQRQRQQAKKELITLFERAKVSTIEELEQKYRTFNELSERNRELMREQKYLKEKLAKYRQESQSKTQELQQIMADVGLQDLPLEQAMAQFRIGLDRLLDCGKALEQHQQQQQAAQQRIQQTQQQIAQLQQNQQNILKEMGLDDAQQLEKRAAQYALRQQLQEQAAVLEQRARDLLAEDSEYHLRELAQHAPQQQVEVDSDALEAELESIEEQLLSIQTKKSEDVGRLEGVYSELTGGPAEVEEELHLLEQQQAQGQTKLLALDMAWQTLSSLVAQMNREMAPELNQMVSSLVQRITGGKYQDLLVSRDLSIDVSTSESGEPVDVEMLSGGTIDQFYFACRVAIADMVTGGGLPLFLDDSFVQYDDKRLRNMLKLLVELSSTRQIVLLTCQGREVEELARLAPEDHKLIRLEG